MSGGIVSCCLFPAGYTFLRVKDQRSCGIFSDRNHHCDSAEWTGYFLLVSRSVSGDHRFLDRRIHTRGYGLWRWLGDPDFRVVFRRGSGDLYDTGGTFTYRYLGDDPHDKEEERTENGASVCSFFICR